MGLGFSLSELNWFDYLILGIIFSTTFIAFFKGMIRTLLFIITWLGAVVIAVFLPPLITPHIVDYFSEEKVAYMVVTTTVFVLSLIILWIICYNIKCYCNKKDWGLFDRSIGFLFGALLGVILSSSLFFVVDKVATLLSLDKDSEVYSWYYDAKTYNALNITTSVISSYIPEKYYEKIDDTIIAVKDSPFSILQSGDRGFSNTILGEKNTETMKELMLLLPGQDLQDIYQSEGESTNDISDKEKRIIFVKILELYKQNLLQGKISGEDLIDGERIRQLELSLSEKNETDYNTGYKKKNLQQLDRLIDNVQQ